MKSSRIVYAFADQVGEGNGAGVVLLDDILQPGVPFDEVGMQALAAEIGMSETAFVARRHSGPKDEFEIRFFTPTDEIDMCGHATVASFSFLKEQGLLGCGSYQFRAKDSAWTVLLDNSMDSMVWIDFGQAEIDKPLSLENVERLCEAMGISRQDLNPDLPAIRIKAGVADLHIFVKSQEVLNKTSINKERLIAICKELNVVGIHESFLQGEQATDSSFIVHSRNFAPLYGIEEECATGTSNAGLTAYLYAAGIIKEEQICKIIQGEMMERVGKIYGKVVRGSDAMSIRIGGRAIVM